MLEDRKGCGRKSRKERQKGKIVKHCYPFFKKWEAEAQKFLAEEGDKPRSYEPGLTECL